MERLYLLPTRDTRRYAADAAARACVSGIRLFSATDTRCRRVRDAADAMMSAAYIVASHQTIHALCFSVHYDDFDFGRHIEAMTAMTGFMRCFRVLMRYVATAPLKLVATRWLAACEHTLKRPRCASRQVIVFLSTPAPSLRLSRFLRAPIPHFCLSNHRTRHHRIPVAPFEK